MDGWEGVIGQRLGGWNYDIGLVGFEYKLGQKGLDYTNECLYNASMDSAAPLVNLKEAVAEFEHRDQIALTARARGEELQELRAVIDRLEREFARSATAFAREGGHLLDSA